MDAEMVALNEEGPTDESEAECEARKANAAEKKEAMPTRRKVPRTKPAARRKAMGSRGKQHAVSASTGGNGYSYTCHFSNLWTRTGILV